MIIEVPRLNYRVIPIVIRDLGDPARPRFNLTDFRVIFTVKEHLTDDEVLVRIQKDNIGGGIDITDALEGEIEVILTPGDMVLPSSDYWYDIFVIRDEEAYSSKPQIFRVVATVLGELP